MTPPEHDPTMNDSQRLVRIETLLIGMTSQTNDHETRLRRLERIIFIGIGLAAAGGSAVGSYIGQLGGLN